MSSRKGLMDIPGRRNNMRLLILLVKCCHKTPPKFRKLRQWKLFLIYISVLYSIPGWMTVLVNFPLGLTAWRSRFFPYHGSILCIIQNSLPSSWSIMLDVVKKPSQEDTSITFTHSLLDKIQSCSVM